VSRKPFNFDNIILLGRITYDLGKKLIIPKKNFSGMGITMNTDKMKVMIIKSKKVTYNTFVYENNSLEEFHS